MKTAKRIVLFTIIAALFGGVLMYGNKGLAFAENVSKAQKYGELFQPDIGSYYAVESQARKGTSIFVICKKVTPQVGGTVVDKGELITIEIPPASGTGLVKGPYLKVSEVRGVLTTRYFPSARDVVQDALEN